jgi:choline dehydrogenase-like flavoprotein
MVLAKSLYVHFILHVHKIKYTGYHVFISVGSGSSGSVVAYRLGEDPTVKILVLEAGEVDSRYDDVSVPRTHMALWNHPDADWGYLTEPQKSSCLLNVNNVSPYRVHVKHKVIYKV